MISFVATPIGNLKDITLRALEELRAADVIFCEDTRHTVKLLLAYDIKKPLAACHKFNERKAAEQILALSREGKRIAIVSDAGMPAISDPGNAVCRYLKEQGEPYTVLPGASACLAALLLSAFPSREFTFLGFLPEKRSERLEELKRHTHVRNTLLLHVAPQDIDGYVEAAFSAFGERRACLVREITKIHEESVEFLLSEGYRGERRGESVLVIEGAREENELLSLSVREHVKHYMDRGMDKKEALKQVAKERKIAKSELYRETIDL